MHHNGRRLNRKTLYGVTSSIEGTIVYWFIEFAPSKSNEYLAIKCVRLDECVVSYICNTYKSMVTFIAMNRGRAMHCNHSNTHTHTHTHIYIYIYIYIYISCITCVSLVSLRPRNIEIYQNITDGNAQLNGVVCFNAYLKVHYLSWLR